MDTLTTGEKVRDSKELELKEQTARLKKVAAKRPLLPKSAMHKNVEINPVEPDSILQSMLMTCHS